MNTSDINEMSIRQINKLFREKEKVESKKWPICGRFNAADRAIRRLQRRRREGLECNPGLEYYLALEAEIGRVVNEY